MTITNLTTMGLPEEEQKKIAANIIEKIGIEKAEFCYQCAKCTSGCEAMKLLELEPHRIMGLVKIGFIDELINSEIIWMCVTCMKCKERCPQNMSPVDVLFALKNMVVKAGKQIPGDYSNMLQTVLGTGLVQGVQEVRTKDNQVKKREDFGLGEVSKPKDMGKFMQVLMKVAMESF